MGRAFSGPRENAVLHSVDLKHGVHSLDSAIDDRFAYCRGNLLLALPETGDVLTCASLADAGVLESILSRYSAIFPGADRRAVVSMWMMYYFSILAISFAVHRLVYRRRLPMSMEGIRLVCKPTTAQPQAFLLSGPGTYVGSESALADFHLLMDEHIEPLIAAISGNAPAAPKLLWNNLAGYLYWIVKEIGRQADSGMADDVMPILESPQWPGGKRNPLFGMIRTLPGQCGSLHPQRKVCCMRYMLPGVSGCGDLCPLPDGRK